MKAVHGSCQRGLIIIPVVNIRATIRQQPIRRYGWKCVIQGEPGNIRNVETIIRRMLFVWVKELDKDEMQKLCNDDTKEIK